MGKFNRDKRSDSGRPSMHQAICSDCGKPCEVPFRPTGDRPVYCASCFEKHGHAPARSDGGRPSFDDKRKFEAICASCGKRCEVPFRPSGDKPVYCSDCFKKSGKDKGRGQEPGKDQLAMISAKLDQILRVLAPKAALAPEKTAKKAEAKPKKEVKARAGKKAPSKKKK